MPNEQHNVDGLYQRRVSNNHVLLPMLLLMSMVIFFAINSSVNYVVIKPSPRIIHTFFYLSIFIFIVCFCVQNNQNIVRLYISKKTISLVGFLLYLSLYSFVYQSPQDFRQTIVGSAGGVLLFLLLGLITNHAISSLYELSWKSFRVRFMFFTFLLLTVYFSFDLLYQCLAALRSDIMLVKGGSLDYQRPSNYISLFVFIFANVFIIFIEKVRNTLLRNLLLIFLLCLVVMLALVILMYGSNKNSILLAWYAILISIYFLSRRYFSSWRKLENILGAIYLFLFNRKAKLFYLFFIILLVSYFSYHGLPDIRWFDFGSSSISNNSSVSSRLALLSNFWVQFSVNPIFGRPDVASITTGVGTYPHSSLLSILTNLGLMGFFMFISFLLYYFSERVRLIKYSTSKDKAYNIFIMLTFTSVLFLSIVGTFFTWSVLWFILGMFYYPARIKLIRNEIS